MKVVVEITREFDVDEAAILSSSEAERRRPCETAST